MNKFKFLFCFIFFYNSFLISCTCPDSQNNGLFPICYILSVVAAYYFGHIRQKEKNERKLGVTMGEVGANKNISLELKEYALGILQNLSKS